MPEKQKLFLFWNWLNVFLAFMGLTSTKQVWAYFYFLLLKKSLCAAFFPKNGENGGRDFLWLIWACLQPKHWGCDINILSLTLADLASQLSSRYGRKVGRKTSPLADLFSTNSVRKAHITLRVTIDVKIECRIDIRADSSLCSKVIYTVSQTNQANGAM